MIRAYKFVLFVLAYQLHVGKALGSNFLGPNPLLEAASRCSSIEKLDECFCELSGPVDVCCCDVELVDLLNHENVHPLVTELVQQTFFKFFRIDLNRRCPFWSDDGRCVLKDCHVEECLQEELPPFLKDTNDTPVEIEESHESCDQPSEVEKQLSTIVVPNTISEQQKDEFNEWSRQDDDFCELEETDDTSINGSYVDLVLNPERYTGYAGHSTHRIWSAIYRENCFSDHLANPLDTQELCLEKRAFYRLISGLHASINIHLCAEYIVSGGSTSNPKFGPNLNEFVRRFDAASTKGQGPGWLKNLYFAYLVVLRAVTKAEDIWRNSVFHTLDAREDELVKRKVLKLVQEVKRCGQDLFDESQMFNGDTSHQLKEEFRVHFRNISRIMDCVGCDKCQLWGTVQVQGVGTALKILFNGHKTGIHLTRQEIVSLFNVLARLSESIEFLQLFRNMQNFSSCDQYDSREKYEP